MLVIIKEPSKLIFLKFSVNNDLELLLAKRNAYGLDSRFLYFLFFVLNNRKQAAKVNST